MGTTYVHETAYHGIICHKLFNSPVCDVSRREGSFGKPMYCANSSRYKVRSPIVTECRHNSYENVLEN